MPTWVFCVYVNGELHRICEDEDDAEQLAFHLSEDGHPDVTVEVEPNYGLIA